MRDTDTGDPLGVTDAFPNLQRTPEIFGGPRELGRGKNGDPIAIDIMLLLHLACVRAISRDHALQLPKRVARPCLTQDTAELKWAVGSRR